MGKTVYVDHDECISCGLCITTLLHLGIKNIKLGPGKVEFWKLDNEKGGGTHPPFSLPLFY